MFQGITIKNFCGISQMGMIAIGIYLIGSVKMASHVTGERVAAI
jgi:hypothetical protein